MANTWYTNIQDFLDLDGLPPVDLPHAGELLLDYFGSIIEAVTSRDEQSRSSGDVVFYFAIFPGMI